MIEFIFRNPILECFLFRLGTRADFMTVKNLWHRPCYAVTISGLCCVWKKYEIMCCAVTTPYAVCGFSQFIQNLLCITIYCNGKIRSYSFWDATDRSSVWYGHGFHSYFEIDRLAISNECISNKTRCHHAIHTVTKCQHLHCWTASCYISLQGKSNWWIKVFNQWPNVHGIILHWPQQINTHKETNLKNEE